MKVYTKNQSGRNGITEREPIPPHPINSTAIIVDIDGTLSDTQHRQHHLEGGRKDWKSFFEACVNDPTYREIKFLCIAVMCMRYAPIKLAPTLILCTGRPSDYSDHTARWLEREQVPFDWLYMRSEGDTRPDVAVKLEMLNRIRGLGYDVMVSVDDRPEVVAMWRSNGVPCLQVDPVTWKRAPSLESTETQPIKWLEQMASVPGADPMFAKTLAWARDR